MKFCNVKKEVSDITKKYKRKENDAKGLNKEKKKKKILPQDFINDVV